MPDIGDSVKWLPRDPTRRKLGTCKGTYVGTDTDGWYLVRYVWGAPGAYKNRTVRIEPRYVVEVKPCAKSSEASPFLSYAQRLRDGAERLRQAREKHGL